MMDRLRHGAGRVRRGAAAALLGLVMVGCGGGGGGGDDIDVPPSAPVRFGASFPSNPVAVTVVEGQDTGFQFLAFLEYNGTEPVTIALEEPQDLIVDGDFNIADNGALSGRFVLDPARPPGVYRSEILLRACLNDACSREVDGSPARVPLVYEVLPQIAVDAPQPMRRRGAEAAPTQRLAVRAPPQAGDLQLATSGDAYAFDISLANNVLTVRPRQVPAGSYVSQVEVRSATDSRFARAVRLEYVVEPPEGGELPLRATPGSLELTLDQGATATRRIRIDPPTWTDAPLDVQLLASPVVRSLRALGNGEWEIEVDTRGVPQSPDNAGGPYVATIEARVQVEGQTLMITPRILVYVAPPLQAAESPLTWRLGTTSTAAELVRSVNLASPDGQPWSWTASTGTPWLRLERASGTIGTDALTVALDPSVLDTPQLQVEGAIELRSARPGTSPVTLSVLVLNGVPRLESASPAVLTGSSALVYLAGALGREAGALDPAVLRVEGAIERSRQLSFDTRFVGDVSLLRLSLDGIAAGRDVTLTLDVPLRRQSLVLRAVAPEAVPAGHAALPNGRYRPPAWMPAARALVFAGEGRVWRWALEGGVWTTPMSRPLDGLIDVDPAPDESELRALAQPDQTLALDPMTLQTRRTGRLPAPGFAADEVLDPATLPALSALRHASDGRAFASVRAAGPLTDLTARGVGWITGYAGSTFSTDLTQSPIFGDPGNDHLRGGSGPMADFGAGTTRSPGRTMLLSSYPQGFVLRYQDLSGQRQPADPVAPGRVVVAVDDQAAWILQDDGTLRRSGSPNDTLALAALVDAGLTPGGYALSGAGDFALVYAWRQADEGGVSRARDAVLLQFDLRAGLAGLRSQPAPVARITLPDAVGCLSAGAACAHTAHVAVSPGDNSAAVLGPQGVAAVALPALPPRAALSAGPRKTLRRGLQPAR